MHPLGLPPRIEHGMTATKPRSCHPTALTGRGSLFYSMPTMVVVLTILLASTASAWPPSNSPWTQSDPAGDAAAVIAGVNNVRGANGVGPLQVDPSLMVAAQRHSEYMASVCVPSHTEPGHSQVSDRALAAGYGAGNLFVVRENVAGGTYTPTEVVDSWVASEGHFWAMIRPEDMDIGVGVAWGCGWRYYTLNMGHVLWGVPRPADTTSEPGALGAQPSLPEGSYIFHVVQAGESPWSIAQLYGITDNEVLGWNYLSPGDPIYAGQRLLLLVTPTPTPSQAPAQTTTPSTPTLPPFPRATPTPARSLTPPPRAAGAGADSVAPVLVLLGSLVVLSGIAFSLRRAR
jgi:uncharacterized protein YkwD